MFLNKPFVLKFYLALAILESAIALTVLALIPSDPKNALFLGYSASRLALMGFAISAMLVFGLLLASAQKLVDLVSHFLEKKISRNVLTVLLLLVIAVCVSVLLIPSQRWGDVVYQVERLAPLLVWAALLALQTLILQYVWIGGKPDWQQLLPWKGALRITTVTGTLLLVFAVLIAWSRIGIEPDRSGWLAPGTPLLFVQVFLAWTIGLVLLLWGDSLENWRNSRLRFTNLDLLTGILLWLAAVIIWWSEPLRDYSYFSPEPTAPNFEYYPFSDARLYDLSAQGILIGLNDELGLFLRPLYAFFLALLHSMDGQQYEKTIFLQILVLAVIPSLMFGLGTMLGSRAGGIIAAILSILREKNSIALTNVIEVSHSKLLLSDVPALALLLLFLFLFIRWLGRAQDKVSPGVIAGASLGLLILIRNQAQLLIPLVLISIIFILRSRWRKMLQGVLAFSVGLFVMVFPWVWRNYQVSGHFFVENTAHYSDFLASSYTTETTSIDKLPGESAEAYYQRMRQQIIDFVVEHPGEVAKFYTSHFLHNEIESIVYLPMSLRLYDLRSYVKDMGFWKSLQIDLSPGSVILFFLTLGLIALGIGAAVNQMGALALVPLLIHLGYSFSVVPARMSGWRFILPVDWVPMLYYAIGLAQVTALALAVLSKRFADIGSGVERAESLSFAKDGRNSILAIAAALLIGLSLPLTARLVPARYPPLTQTEIIRSYLSDGLTFPDGSVIDAAALEDFSNTDGAQILYGRALYPTYYALGQYWGDNSPLNVAAREYDRIQFYVMGPQRGDVFLPLSSPPDAFPHTSEVVVIGCANTGAFTRALAVVINNEVTLTASPWTGLTCAAINNPARLP